ncbi:MAG: AAA family ATPase [Solirubrobacterales bacterium]
MDALLNPYTPGAGTPPRELAGREPELRRFELLLERLSSGRGERGIVLQGLRGVGKTVLMREFAERAAERGWGVGRLEVTSDADLRTEMASMAGAALRQISAKARARETLLRAARFVKAFTIRTTEGGAAEISVDLEAALSEPVGSDIERDTINLFVEIGAAAAANGTGVVFLIDEMQLLGREDLEAICAAAHRASQDSLPVAVVGAGLPILPERLAAAKSYAERLFVFPELGALEETAARRAIERPAESAVEGRPVRYEERAVDTILRLSECYPYFIQAYGLQAWNAAPEGDLIRARDAESAAEPAREELDRDFFETRFARATKAGRRYLAAMADLGDGPYRSTDVAERGGWRTVMSAGPVRQTLIEKGLIYSPDHGMVDFTVPHFSHFMRRKHPRGSLPS